MNKSLRQLISILKGFRSFMNKSLRRLISFGLHWAPLWAPLVLLVQITLLGLRPALQERSRLEAQRIEVETRHNTSQKAYRKAKKNNDAWQDPIFQARKERVWSREANDRKAKLKAPLPQEGEGDSTPRPPNDSR
jgi:hypothetical protein